MLIEHFIYLINRCMTPEYRQRLNADRIAKEKKKLEQDQRYHIGQRQVDKKASAYNRSVSASNDDYMRKVMGKIRQDTRSHSDDLTMFSGSYLHSKSQE